jgi:hypothetical protein
MGFCSEEQAKRFLQLAPLTEKSIVDSGIVLLKYWLEVSQYEQTRRLASRINDGRRIWKLSPMDLKSYSRCYDYSRARDEMFKASDTPWAPWYGVRSDDKKRAAEYHHPSCCVRSSTRKPRVRRVRLPDRQRPHGYKEPDYPYKLVPELNWPVG